MSADLEQFYEVFFEESSELLAEMETCLLRLDVNSPDLEDMNAIFRAAHSIKGGAGTFGFTDMTEMTHMLETLLDKLRKGELPVRSEMVDAFLKAGDVIKDQLAGHRGDGGADEAVAAEVSAELKKFCEEIPGEGGAPASSESTKSASTPEVTQPETQSSDTEAADSDGDSPKAAYKIEFAKEGLSAAALENLYSNLREQGALTDLSAADSDMHQLQLVTSDSEEDVWETLAFVVDPAHLHIALKQDDEVVSGSATAQAEPGYGLFSEESGAPAGGESKAVEASQSQPEPQPQPESQPQPQSQNSEVKKVPAQTNAKSAANAKPAAASSETTSIRVSIEKVDQMINLVGELVITQAMLAQTASQVDPVLYEKLHSGMGQLERNTRDLQESVMSIRMMPISFVFSRYPRVVRDLASKLNKHVELKTEGEGTELDKGLIEKIADPLTHLVRNSLDHGVETPEKRIAAGKSAQGTITLKAFHQGGSIVIQVNDDGAGLNRDKILEKAQERGIAVSDNMSDQDVWMLIFEAGFSTAETVTDVSGRGVGMDVVKRNIVGMGGRIEIDSTFGVGTRISIRLPLTLAILDGLSVTIGDQMFIVPLTYIVESLQPVAEDIKTLSGRGYVVKVRGEYLPIIALHEIFNLRPDITEFHKGILVILEAEGRKAALFVDNLVGQHQVVIKSLESNYRRVKGVSGATIMGDGKVALILDTAGLVLSSQQEEN